jgi:tripartite-type tricarboxylate transporter receptor subunit TctC
MNYFLRATQIVASVCMLLITAPSGAQEYPTRPIKLIVPYPPGGSLDLVARVISPKLGARLGQPIVVENRGGAAGVIGCEAVARAAPDGYTVLLSAPATLPVLAALNRPIPYDPVNDFTPLAILVTNPNAIVVTPDFPAKSLKELVEYVKKNPGKVAYATSGTGTTQHLGAVTLEQFAGLNWLHVPYKGGTPAYNDLLGGQIKIGFVSLSTAMPFVKAGKLRMLAVLDSKRSPAAMDVPTNEEALPGYASTLSWVGAFGPAKLPSAVAQRLSSELVKVMHEPDVIKYINATGQTSVAGSAQQMARLVEDDIKTYTKIIKSSKVPIE